MKNAMTQKQLADDSVIVPEKLVTEMSRKEFDALPNRKWNEDIGEFDSMVILPLRTKHDSGYRCLDFVAVRQGKPICKLAGGSDVVHLNGIGGYGLNWLYIYGTCPKQVPPVDWSIDCLPKSGLLQIFTSGKMRAGTALSSFELFHIKKAQ